MTGREYISRAEVMARTGLRRTTATTIMHEVARRAGLDLAARGQRALLLPLDAWHAHSGAVLAPSGPSRAPRAPASPIPRPARSSRPHGPEERPAVALTKPRGRRP